MYKIYCDLCNKEIEDFKREFTFYTKIGYTNENIYKIEIDQDLCLKCLKKEINYLIDQQLKGSE